MVSACCEGDVANIVSLIEEGESPNSVGHHGYTPVMRAIHSNELSAVKVLFGFGADLSKVDGNGSSVIHIAAEAGDEEAIKWLLNKSSININSTNNDGSTAAMLAMWHGKLNSAILLFKRGALLSIADDNGENLLHAAIYGEDDTGKDIKWLLEKNAIDVNLAATDGNTPVTLALKWGGLASAKLLVERGANLFMKNNMGKRAIDIQTYLSNGEQLGPQVLLHAKELRWSAIKDFLLLSKACQSQDRRVAEGDATTLSCSRSVRLAASIFAVPGLLRHVGSYIIRSDIIVRDKSIPKPPDAVKLRGEAALKAAAAGSSSSKNT
jgi:ankyrin repeat protein